MGVCPTRLRFGTKVSRNATQIHGYIQVGMDLIKCSIFASKPLAILNIRNAVRFTNFLATFPNALR